MNVMTPPALRHALDTLARPNREEAEAAIRTSLRWVRDDPNREGLVDSPARVACAYEEFFAGYEADPVALLACTFRDNPAKRRELLTMIGSR